MKVGECMNEKVTYTIAEMAERFGVTYRTLHYYESKIGLNINRSSSGDRIYSESDVEIFEMIFDLKSKGMSLDGIRKLFVEKGILKSDPFTPMVIMDDKSIDFQKFITDVVSSKLTEIMKTTNDKLDQIIKENEDLRNELRKIQLTSEDHYIKIDKQLTDWKDSKSTPWYKKIFKK